MQGLVPAEASSAAAVRDYEASLCFGLGPAARCFAYHYIIATPALFRDLGLRNSTGLTAAAWYLLHPLIGNGIRRGLNVTASRAERSREKIVEAFADASRRLEVRVRAGSACTSCKLHEPPECRRLRVRPVFPQARRSSLGAPLRQQTSPLPPLLRPRLFWGRRTGTARGCRLNRHSRLKSQRCAQSCSAPLRGSTFCGCTGNSENRLRSAALCQGFRGVDSTPSDRPRGSACCLGPVADGASVVAR